MKLVDVESLWFDYSGLSFIHSNDYKGIAEYFFNQLKNAPTIDLKNICKQIANECVRYQYGGEHSADEGEYFTGCFGSVKITSSREKDSELAREKAVELEADWLYNKFIIPELKKI